ncbi:hypothetical protein GCM10022244_43840 [Streptomyces gulbargensis]|uniref:Uncharacterized protein n=1 Tax=Streptomyces gulbargensis TaxID=364901 RepID=A0ABP7MXG5_9ACTN
MTDAPPPTGGPSSPLTLLAVSRPRSGLWTGPRLWKTPSPARVKGENAEGPVAGRDGALGRTGSAQAAEVELLAPDDDVDAAGFASEEDEADGAEDAEPVEDFDAPDEAGELLDEEPRLSFR